MDLHRDESRGRRTIRSTNSSEWTCCLSGRLSFCSQEGHNSPIEEKAGPLQLDSCPASTLKSTALEAERRRKFHVPYAWLLFAVQNRIRRLVHKDTSGGNLKRTILANDCQILRWFQQEDTCATPQDRALNCAQNLEEGGEEARCDEVGCAMANFCWDGGRRRHDQPKAVRNVRVSLS